MFKMKNLQDLKFNPGDITADFPKATFWNLTKVKRLMDCWLLNVHLTQSDIPAEISKATL